MSIVLYVQYMYATSIHATVSTITCRGMNLLVVTVWKRKVFSSAGVFEGESSKLEIVLTDRHQEMTK